MIQDVIDLRRDKWIPRRNDSKPKLINEIEKDAKNEAMEQSMARESYRPEKPRDHHRNDDNKFRGGDSKSRSKYFYKIKILFNQNKNVGFIYFNVFLNDSFLTNLLSEKYTIYVDKLFL